MASKHQTKLIKEYEAKGYYVIKLLATNKTGIPDIVCLKPNEPAIFIESKEKNDRLSPLQVYRLEELKSLGFVAFESKATK